MSIRTLPTVIGLLTLLASVSVAQDTLSLDALKARYERIDDLRASFTQTIRSEIAGDSTQIRGQVLLSGNKYRVETPSQTVVTNGKTTWIYSPADSQVVINDAEKRTSTITPQTFLTTSTDQYKTTSTRSVTKNGVPHTVLSLEATASSTRFKTATLWVRRSDRLVTRLRATDRNASTLTLDLRDLTVDPSLSGTPFRFSPPDGIEVVDLRSNTSQ
ncbi:MAG: outer membrane lipoprotein chaperone LolA [Salinibacter sp.]|uniref:outer membrane lipoprotein chaperone LolA n=1 Tax=Salinibacter sp. TaxID=2065818 RepID=UPI0035D3DEE9